MFDFSQPQNPPSRCKVPIGQANECDYVAGGTACHRETERRRTRRSSHDSELGVAGACAACWVCNNLSRISASGRGGRRFFGLFQANGRDHRSLPGDVSGKGLSAALYAGLAVGTLRGVHKTGTSPSDVLATLNRRLMIRGMPRRHAAMQYAVFDPHSHEVRIASAGMPGPFHLSANGCRNLKLCGIPPGLFAAANYETLTLRLLAGNSVLFCTDGRSEERRVGK